MSRLSDLEAYQLKNLCLIAYVLFADNVCALTRYQATFTCFPQRKSTKSLLCIYLFWTYNALSPTAHTGLSTVADILMCLQALTLSTWQLNSSLTFISCHIFEKQLHAKPSWMSTSIKIVSFADYGDLTIANLMSPPCKLSDWKLQYGIAYTHELGHLGRTIIPLTQIVQLVKALIWFEVGHYSSFPDAKRL